ncbi:RagB/SusD family nutrient uptake outer membrane protein [Pseudobacter ginsenosidimutans]|uniref:SusD-like starch-binding protein associating with outer membrane n=1 Tax=Pseudobacter ginsenosidimutans TaxID=661488 RepID=A0A4Q7N271_9BACT|nr:RagB/SusD family nutrient uptake outer membrane protein [Pseudobacter ginsenosidimutans]RZS75392.1 SusD-like starch-binding protein associating with outer membrane [Pseudobacter ginsenosidimutans]
MRNKSNISTLCLIVLSMAISSCNKLLEVPPPINSITTEEVFSNNAQAEWTLAAIYSKMINGYNTSTRSTTITEEIFSSGLATILGGLSADELTYPVVLANPNYIAFSNKLTVANSDKTSKIWNSAYRFIFDANAAIAGLSAATALTDSVKKQLTGEALALRAFCYFYLVNFFGDVPLMLNPDFHEAQNFARTPTAKVYTQIKKDLVDAKAMLAGDYSVSNNERIRANKWFAEAMLARVYLYTGEYQLAINSATAVINHTSLFTVEQDLTKTFLPNNTEAILQLKPAKENTGIVNGTPEGYTLYTAPVNNGPYNRTFEISTQLANAFEANDLRKTTWTVPAGTASVSSKYTRNQRVQYYNVIRLAELHLIRAEAIARHVPGNKSAAIEDINVLRRRAGVTELDEQLTAEQVIDAVAHERQVELFLEWGHRWLDLKRTGKAGTVLGAIPAKQPWWGDYQLLYPIPAYEIRNNSHLQQNPEYNL